MNTDSVGKIHSSSKVTAGGTSDMNCALKGKYFIIAQLI
jgi:hypothetical protein